MSTATSLAEKANSLPSAPAMQDPLLAIIERVAVNPDADINKMQQILEMRATELRREAEAQFYSALSHMQVELPEVEKVASGHNIKYAKFEHILKAIKPTLSKYGFAITHRVKTEDNFITVTAVLSHQLGHREETSLALPFDKTGSKNDVQAIGSSSEYGRRYTMNALLGIATRDADADGGVPAELSAEAQSLIALVAKAETEDGLKKAYTEAFKALGNDNFAKGQLIAIKNQRKKDLGV